MRDFYKVRNTKSVPRVSPVRVRVTSETTSDAIARNLESGARIAALNFANNEAPHGGYDYTRGHTQEEYLFRETTIAETLVREHYPICESPEDSRAFVSTNVRLKHDPTGSVFTIITIAALTGLRVRSDLSDIDIDYYVHAVDRANTERRIRLICKIAARMHVDVLITGAWGCGVFCNPVYEVCQIWKKYIRKYEIPRVEFAIPPGHLHDLFSRFLADLEKN
jgi:uncharacterized protein (TIGR02452 family)